MKELQPAAAAGRARLTIPATVEQTLLAACLFWTASANDLFFGAALSDRSWLDAATWAYALALGTGLAALHFVLLAPWASRWTLKPLLVLLTVTTALATHYMHAFGLYLDPSMVRSVVHTDVAEAREVLTGSLLLHLMLYAGLPLALLWRVRLVRRSWTRAVAVRAGATLCAVFLAAVSIWAVFQPFSSLMRNQKEVRYLVTPANYLWSLASVSLSDARAASVARRPIGLDAVLDVDDGSSARPSIVVMVVGETARAANWGLNGYQRQTTPELARRDVITFDEVVSCGTNTEVSVPCMFAPVGRRDYDEGRIRASESLLHVVARAGVAVQWVDNQSGCKGVCDGLPQDTAVSLNAPGLCGDGRCLDEALLVGLDDQLANAKGSRLLVLHQLGNHGPSYFRRYPPAFERFVPACRDDDLRRCTRQEIVNAYDNALLYTDHVLARLIDLLQAHAADVDSAVLYVSDHGESLGEMGLYLHGLPYAIAPPGQTRVPMAMWFSAGFERRAGLDADCLRQRARAPASHDHLFHTLLDLLDVRTSLYEPDWNLLHGCREPATRVARHP